MSLPDLSARDRTAVELMDDPECDLPALERTYAQFRVVNAVVAGWQLAYRRHVRPLLRDDRVTTILDVGCGGGDLARALARWARRDGRRAQVTGIDPDPRAHAWAARQPPVPGVSFRCAHSSDLVAEGRRFDVVVSNHVLHHLDEHGLRTLLEAQRKPTPGTGGCRAAQACARGSGSMPVTCARRPSRRAQRASARARSPPPQPTSRTVVTRSSRSSGRTCRR